MVRKVASYRDQYIRVEKYEFRVEVLNVKKLSFKDITLPCLYKFSEDIQLLPTGLSFLDVFLGEPLRYFKYV